MASGTAPGYDSTRLSSSNHGFRQPSFNGLPRYSTYSGTGGNHATLGRNNCSAIGRPPWEALSIQTHQHKAAEYPLKQRQVMPA